MKPCANLFDLLAGWVLDKRLLAHGIRVASASRLVLAAIAARLFLLPAIAWPDVVVCALLLLNEDVGYAMRKAPQAAMNALGSVAGSARSAFQATTSAFKDPVAEGVDHA